MQSPLVRLADPPLGRAPQLLPLTGAVIITIRFQTTRPAYQYVAHRIGWGLLKRTQMAPRPRARTLEAQTPTAGPACIRTRMNGLASAAPIRKPTSVVSKSSN